MEIGANTTIDRGATRDTIIGEGTKIDNLVQIGHNVVIGRGCVIVAQSGLAGSCELGDFVALGGQSAIGGHLTIGEGAQIAAKAGVTRDVPPCARWSGAPARPARRHLRGELLLDRMARRDGASPKVLSRAGSNNAESRPIETPTSGGEETMTDEHSATRSRQRT